MSLLDKLFRKKPKPAEIAAEVEKPALPTKALKALAAPTPVAPKRAPPAPPPEIEIVIPLKAETEAVKYAALPAPKPEELVVLDVPLKPGVKPAVITLPTPRAAAPAPAALPPAPKPPAAPRPKHVYEARREAREAARKEESEAEMVLHDIVKEVETQVAQTRPGAPVHRMYLLKRAKPEERAASEGGVRVIASKRLAEKEEFQAMVGDVYEELKKARAEEGVKERLEVKKPPAVKPAEKPAEAAARPAEVSFEELMGIKPAAEAKATPPAAALPEAKLPEAKPLFAELETIVKPEAKAPPLAKPVNAEFVSMQAEPAMGCPHCKSKGLKIVFCPYCGSGLCANCSPKVTPGPEAIVYACPSCGEEITVRKKMG